MGGKNKQTRALAESMAEKVLVDEPSLGRCDMNLCQKTDVIKKHLGIDTRMPIIPCVDAAYHLMGLEKNEGATITQSVDILLDFFF